MSRHALGSGVDPDEITTEGWLTQWLDERVSDRAIGRSVAHNYRWIIENHLVPAIGGVRLQDLRDANILKLKSDLLQSHRPGTVQEDSRPAPPGASLRGHSRADRQQPGIGRVDAVAGTRAKIRTLARSARARSRNCSVWRTTTPYDTLIRFALATGARQAEVLGATWRAIDLERGTFHVPQTLQVVGGEFRLVAPKTDRLRRTIELSPTTVQLLREHRDAQNATQLELGEEWEDHDLVFPAERGRYWHRAVFYRGLPRAGRCERDRKAVGRVNFHSLQIYGGQPVDRGRRRPADGFVTARTRVRNRSRWMSTGTCCPGNRAPQLKRSTTRSGSWPAGDASNLGRGRASGPDPAARGGQHSVTRELGRGPRFSSRVGPGRAAPGKHPNASSGCPAR